MKKFLLISIFLFVMCQFVQAQTKKINYISADKLTLVGKVFNTPNPYHRVDTMMFNSMPSNVKQRFICSAGIAISFKTNSKNIYAKWTSGSLWLSPNITPVNTRGLDLYIKKDGKWQFASVARPNMVSEITNTTIIANLTGEMIECLLYLPTYSEVLDLSVGVDNKAIIVEGSKPFEKTVVIYGSSIAQGASASRSGMAYPARMSRATGINFVNMGTSGLGNMQPEVVAMLTTIKADAFILDCVPNCMPEEITERTNCTVTEIRKHHPNVPIIMVQSIIREYSHFNQVFSERMKMQNDNFEIEYNKLKEEGVNDLYFIAEGNFLGTDHEGTTDGTHPNDLGFDRMISVIQPQIIKILKKYK